MCEWRSKMLIKIITTSLKNITLEAKLMIPQTNQPKGLIVYHRGTIFEERNSVLKNGIFTDLFESVVKSGYIVLLPEFIGFGSTKHLPHPYHIEKYLSINSFLLIKESIKHLEFTSNKLFISGYSEGAYIGYSLLKNFEDKLLRNFNSIHTIIGAGLYDVYGSIANGIQTSHYSKPEYIAYLFHAYTYYYNFKLDEIFKKEYIDEIKECFGDRKCFPTHLTTNLDELFLSSFKKHFPSNLKLIFEKNSLINFQPKTKVTLYHSKDDEIVSVKNSEIVFRNIYHNGDVNLILDDTLSHLDASSKYFKVLFSNLF